MRRCSTALDAFRGRNIVGTLLLFVATVLPHRAAAQMPSQAELLERLQRLERNQTQMQGELEEKDKRIDALEEELRRTRQAETPPPAVDTPPSVPTAQVPTPPSPVEVEASQIPPPASGDATIVQAPTPGAEPPRRIGIYEPGRGFSLARDTWGELNFGVYTYVRFLEQKGLEEDYVNGFGQTVSIDRREDLQLNKVKLEFRGWLMDPRFQYVLYTWTNQTAQGLGAQVVVGGNLNWLVHPTALKVGAGILSLPSTRSTQGTFPNWLTVDHRTIADEFFRASYSQGVYAYGASHGFGYFGMLANNLSTLGVDAGQLDGDFSTASGALFWMPTTGEYGPKAGFGDYEHHRDLATILGVHFTFSPEDRQSQPDQDDFDNTQIRLSNGTVIFAPGALAPDVTVSNVDYHMWAFDAGMKYRGFALEGEYYLRLVNDFRTDGPVPEDEFLDHGFQVQTSYMLLPKTLQFYNQSSYIFGEFGDAWETTFGFNWFFFKRREVRLNLEYIYDHESPTGGLSYPQVVGGTGSIFNANLEITF